MMIRIRVHISNHGTVGVFRQVNLLLLVLHPGYLASCLKFNHEVTGWFNLPTVFHCRLSRLVHGSDGSVSGTHNYMHGHNWRCKLMLHLLVDTSTALLVLCIHTAIVTSSMVPKSLKNQAYRSLDVIHLTKGQVFVLSSSGARTPRPVHI